MNLLRSIDWNKLVLQEINALQRKPATRGTAFMIHGFWGVRAHLQLAALMLRQDGWDVRHFGYRSRSETLQDAGHRFAGMLEQTIRLSSQENPICYFTHSMGALVLRAALSSVHCPEAAKVGRAAMLGPPLRGAMIARTLSNYSIARSVLGHGAGLQMMNTPLDGFDQMFCPFPNTLDLMVIAGNVSVNPLLDEVNDGVVCVAETFVHGRSHHHHIVPLQHTMLPFSPSVLKLVRKFINEESDTKRFNIKEMNSNGSA